MDDTVRAASKGVKMDLAEQLLSSLENARTKNSVVVIKHCHNLFNIYSAFDLSFIGDIRFSETSEPIFNWTGATLSQLVSVFNFLTKRIPKVLIVAKGGLIREIYSDDVVLTNVKDLDDIDESMEDDVRYDPNDWSPDTVVSENELNDLALADLPKFMLEKFGKTET